ncbi:CCR4-NOT core DEDD family RNase subunit POP2 KNAG_0D00160 [Huiozyma naganishii CBS 8797]|uniref:poly(A)-specific ribonuclease n=1 Tax=Huiozyma naganishii (strain ATCC MYA-139 / BCRC 22969 / CBS 8797 / KCTC 17520 / NBRC 10181 / NCYC 3082 / Yp74L-3) TaxID=1071383 RepID=J7RJT2_HUIN7|nr:hypothetical protein KNAG_0D00160 [Kazachstania naganishii CBS 8797]CCK69768.1 hypothetical protein KNAG_0D00160 [Kazachstania naganishii CBS 8797]
MQSLNIQPHGLSMGTEQLFMQGQASNEPQQPPGIPMNGMNQMFSAQLNQGRVLNQQPGLLPNLQALTNNQDMSNAYLMKQKIEPMLSQQAAVAAQVQGQLPPQNGQPQPQLSLQGQSQLQQQQQQQPQQAFNINMGSIPPGINVLQQPGMNVGQPVSAQLNMPKQLHMMNNLNNMVGTGVGIGVGGAAPPPPMMLPPPNHLLIRDVWKNNLYHEFTTIRQLIGQYNHVSISSEFVGTLARPIGTFRSKEDYHYQTMRSNVDFLNPIQLGISLSDGNGNKPENGPSTWQFNFNFDIDKEMVSVESLELLTKSGINFEDHHQNGVSTYEFAQLMMDSGLVMDPEVTWITYHAAYDLGFLVNILMNDIMPNNREDFEKWVHTLMPNMFDLNLIFKVIRDLQNPLPQGAQQGQTSSQFTLTSLADELAIPRFPVFTTTGGQSLLMLLCFCQLNKLSMHKFPNGVDFGKYKNIIYGIDGEDLR